VLQYAGVTVAVATMGYKHQNLLYDVKGRKQCSSESIIENMSSPTMGNARRPNGGRCRIRF
jgi:acetoacetate decarboxylase